jgi:RNA polymerase sigma-70 factor, ECF subfamily
VAKRNGKIARLLKNAREGSAPALWELLAFTRDRLLQQSGPVIDTKLQSKGSLADLVEDTIIEAFSDFTQFKGRTSGQWFAWVKQLLHHNFVNFIRRYRSTDKRRVDREVPLSGRGADLEEAPIERKSLTPCSFTLAKEWRQQVNHAINRLPQHYRTVVLLRLEKETSFEVIGSMMGKSPEASRMLWDRAVRMLRHSLSRKYCGELMNETN